MLVGAELFDPRVGDDPALLELLFAQFATGFLDRLAPGNLHFELPFETEHNIEKVDRLGVEVVDQGRFGLHFFFVTAEGVGDDFGHFRIDRLDGILTDVLVTHFCYILMPPSTPKTCPVM